MSPSLLGDLESTRQRPSLGTQLSGCIVLSTLQVAIHVQRTMDSTLIHLPNHNPIMGWAPTLLVLFERIKAGFQLWLWLHGDSMGCVGRESVVSAANNM